MNDCSDQQLLSDYAERRSDAAFGELVRRHLNAVYSAALRMTGEPQAARDIAQGVLVALANNAARLAAHPVLSGWLHCTARNLAAKSIRAEVRRRAREQEAAAMNPLLHAQSDPPWEHIAPHLDAALGELSPADRDAVMLRYFEKKSAPEMSGLLGISEEAAQKRVTRAVERLRQFLAKRGATIGAGGLGLVLSANAVQAAPAGLAAQITAAVLGGTALTATLIMTTVQKTLVTAALAVAVGAGLYETKQAANARAAAQALQEQQAPLAEQVRQLLEERDNATRRVAWLTEALAQAKPDERELLQLRGEVTRLRAQAQAANEPEPAMGDNEESGLAGVNNARGVALDDGTILNFTNGVAVVRDRDPGFADSATARDEYRVLRLLASDDHYDCCVMNLNTGGTGNYTSFGIFTKDDAQVVKSLQMLDLGDRVEFYDVNQDGAGTLSLYYLDRSEGVAMAEPPSLPKKTTFKRDPATGKFIKDTTFVLDTKQAWLPEPPEPREPDEADEADAATTPDKARRN